MEAKTAAVQWDQAIDVSPRLEAPNNSYSGQSLIWSSPALADGKLFAVLDRAFGNKGNGGYSAIGMFDADPTHFAALGVANTKLVGCTSPAVAGTKLFVHTGSGIACYDLAPSAQTRP